MDEHDVPRLAELLKALADETRLRILGLILERPLSVTELAASTRVSAPTVSHHLKRLAAAGLARAEVRGHHHLYVADGEALRSQVASLLSSPTATPLPSDPDDRVLATFLVDGRLRSIPAQLSKRKVVLRHLAGRFEPGRTYPEREVNAILREFHEDVATLRRELVVNRHLARSEGRYQRL